MGDVVFWLKIVVIGLAYIAGLGIRRLMRIPSLPNGVALAVRLAVIITGTMIQYYLWNPWWLGFGLLPLHWFALAEGLFPFTRTRAPQQHA